MVRAQNRHWPNKSQYRLKQILNANKREKKQEDLAVDINIQNWKSSTGSGSPPYRSKKYYFKWRP